MRVALLSAVVLVTACTPAPVASAPTAVAPPPPAPAERAPTAASPVASAPTDPGPAPAATPQPAPAPVASAAPIADAGATPPPTKGAGRGSVGPGKGGGGTEAAAFGVDGRHDHTAPSLSHGAVAVAGRLSPDVVKRVVRQEHGRLRACYDKARASSPDISGRVVVKFAIDAAGNVASASDGGSDVPDKDVVTCMVRTFLTLRFPKPEGGIVSVVYPLVLGSGG